MGAWGAGSFDNDDAGDWVYELNDAEDISIIKGALDAILENKEYLEAPDCSTAIAAAEVVAALRKKPHPEPPEELTAFVKKIGKPPSVNLVAAARKVIARIKAKSELQELWDESESRDEWHQALTALDKRLS